MLYLAFALKGTVKYYEEGNNEFYERIKVNPILSEKTSDKFLSNQRITVEPKFD